ncbi:hypothetical protein FUAX_32130 [Fulvitalea axinellae]|uniref:Uncharacterized protein n=1 Tax=Fulvitalea axinellae TaxID=1182444 RepID=A0AAU9DCB3_9BACT|nr:hypothetical protein FUAX_32130 [Fulvitalea axinellae]
MRKFTVLIVCLLAFVGGLNAQNKLNFQALLRDASGKALREERVDLKFEIARNTPDGTVLFEEEHSITTTRAGILNVEIGSKTMLPKIEWNGQRYFLKVSVNGESLGHSQLLSVPYAMGAEIAGEAESLDYEALSGKPEFEDWDKNVAGDFDGEYQSLDNLPGLFDGEYSELSNLPTLFNGDYSDLLNLPALFDGSYSRLSNLPELFHGDYAKLSNLPSLFSGEYSDLSNRPESYFNGEYGALSNLPVLFDGKYSSLEGAPQTITTEQTATLGRLGLTQAVDLDGLKAQAADNSAKTGFPGIGDDAGKAFRILWAKKNQELYSGRVGVNVNVPETDINSHAGMRVKGAVLYDGLPSAMTPGILYYDPLGSGHFRYVDNTGTEKLFGMGDGDFHGGFAPLQEGHGAMWVDDAILKKRLAVGSGVSAGMDFGENKMVLADTILRVRFEDTSQSASFPKNDWEMVFNDIAENGQSYFAVLDEDLNATPFKLMASAPTNAFRVMSGKVGLGVEIPDEALHVGGAVKANSFVGDGSSLSGLLGVTSSVANTGSTTLGADKDGDGTGRLAFEIGESEYLTVSSTGKVGLGKSSPNADLDVSGSLVATGVDVAGDVSSSGALVHTPENKVIGDLASIDVSGKSLILADLSGDKSISALNGGKKGQRVTIINRSDTHQITFFVGMSNIAGPFSQFTLGKYGAVTFLCDGTYWYQTDLVNP